MAVPSAQRTVSYAGNDATTAFAVPFPFLTSADLKVYWTFEDDEIARDLQVEGVDYEVTGGDGEIGEVQTLWVPEDGGVLEIERTVPFTQPTDFTAQGSFSPRRHEDSLDWLEYQIQQLLERVAALEAVLDSLELGTGSFLIRELAFVTEVEPEDSFPKTFSVPVGFVVSSVTIGKPANVTTPADKMETAPQVGAWSQTGTTVSIEHISGLLGGTSYEFNLLVVAEE